MIKNIEVVVSVNSVLFNELKNFLNEKEEQKICFEYLGTYIEIANFLKYNKKITTLIIGDSVCGVEMLASAAQHIINLSEYSYGKTELKLRKPLKISQLLDQIKILRKQYNQKVFCVINNNIVFDAHRYVINFGEITHKLTEKEVEIIKILLNSPDYSLNKNTLLEKVWGFSMGVDTNTLESHISNLKQKCPPEFIILKNNIYTLKISDLH